MIPFSDIYFIMKISMVFEGTKIYKQAGTWLRIELFMRIIFEARILCKLKKKIILYANFITFPD